MIKVNTATLVAAASAAGCNVQEQKSFFKVTSPEKNRKAIYIAKSKRIATRIDFAGFELTECEVIKALTKEDAKELKLGAVRAQILTKNLPLEVGDVEVLEALEYGISELMATTEGFKFGKKVKVEEEVLAEEVTAEEE